MTQSKLRHVRVAEGKLDGANFRLSHLERVAFGRCGLRDADFYEATLDRVSFDHCDLRSANFARVSPTDLTHMDLATPLAISRFVEQLRSRAG